MQKYVPCWKHSLEFKEFVSPVKMLGVAFGSWQQRHVCVLFVVFGRVAFREPYSVTRSSSVAMVVHESMKLKINLCSLLRHVWCHVIIIVFVYPSYAEVGSGRGAIQSTWHNYVGLIKLPLFKNMCSLDLWSWKCLLSGNFFFKEALFKIKCWPL